VQQTVVNVGSRKCVAGAVILAFLFGPLGMLYATVPGGLIMMVISVLIAIPTLGVGLLITVPAGMIWAGAAASGHNSRLASSAQLVQTPAATSPAAAWYQDPDGSGRMRYWDGVGWTERFYETAHATTATEQNGPVAVTALPPGSDYTSDDGHSSVDHVYCQSCGATRGTSDQFCGQCGARQE
jgi:hypothetical protein